MILTWKAVRDYNAKGEAEIKAAIDLIPDEFKERGSAGRPRLNLNALEDAKGEPEYRFDNPGEMFIIEIPGMYGSRLGLVYVTFYMGFGAIQAVLIENGDANGYMFAEKGQFLKDERSRQWNFFKIKDKKLRKNVAPVQQKINAPAPVLPTRSMGTGINMPAPLPTRSMGTGINMPASFGGRKRTRKQKHRKQTRKHRKSSRKHK